MDSMTYNHLGFTTLSTPNKRKQMEERDDDIVVTPLSSYDSSSDSDSDARDTDSFVSTPYADTAASESPWKRRKISLALRGHHSDLSPPLMPRLKYRRSSLSSQNNERTRSRSYSFAVRGRPVLDIFGDDSNSYEQQQQRPTNDLSFLAIPTPPSKISETKIPSFGLSPRTTLAPRFPELFESRRLFGRSLMLENEDRNPLPSLRMRTSSPQLHKVGTKQLMEELFLPTLTEVTLRETWQDRSNPAAA